MARLDRVLSLVDDGSTGLNGNGHSDVRTSSTLAIKCLGGFQVLRDGVPVAAVEWQSKKSRDLLKLLIARRGRPIHREGLMEVLWPGVGSPLADNRLSVAISRARGILDPDKTFSQDHFIRCLEDVIWLRIHVLDLDVERFLSLSKTGLTAHRAGHLEEAVSNMHEAIDLYGGDFLEDQLYEEWVFPLREEGRASYIGAALALGDIAGERGDYESAVGYYSRVLENDPYAETAHLGLVRSALVVGRHGEARRHYSAYVAHMAELEIEAADFPSPPADVSSGHTR